MQPLEKPKDFPTVKEMARWAYDYLKPLPFGREITYVELTSVITMRADSHRGRTAVLRAGRQLLRDESKLLVNVRGQGYQIARPNEHAAQAVRFRAGARRRLRRALDAVVHIALDGLSPKEVTEVLAEQVRSGLTLAFERRLGRRKALPAPNQTALPSGEKLLSLITKKVVTEP
jgi:hypothetical protein